MILEKDFKERDTEIDGTVDDRIEMGVDTESINHLMMILSSNLYQNPIGSIIREYTSNAIDANVDAGIEEPVIVRLKKVNNNWNFEVQDFGLGLDDNDFRNIISKYGKSTKRDKVDQLGYFGQRN
jgi:HSP90 family molecular chaperone